MFYKWLTETRRGPYSTWRWPKPGEWTPAVTSLVKCVRGYHLCDRTQLSRWCHATLWLAEGRGAHIADEEKHLFTEARLIAPVGTWNDRTARLFACDCAEHVQPADADPRSLNAIAVARRFANGEATREELAAAWDAAWDAEYRWQSARLCEMLGLKAE